MAKEKQQFENLKKVRVFKDSKIQAEYEKTLESFDAKDLNRPLNLITENQSLKLRRAKELAGQYFNKTMAQADAVKNI